MPSAFPSGTHSVIPPQPKPVPPKPPAPAPTNPLAGLTPAQQQQVVLDAQFATFSSGNSGVLAYSPAFGSSFKDTQSYVLDELQKNSRPDVPPAPILPWECRIGGAHFFIPPININVTKTFQSGSITGAAIRQQSSPKFNSGHSDTMISMTIYFPDNNTVWGFDGDKLSIDFDKSNEDVIDRFMSSLRGLVTQFRYTPFLPVKNAYLNGVWNVDSVALQSLTVSTVENYPFCLVANLTMLAFNHEVYLPMVEHLEDAMHWGRFRQYVGRAAVKMAAAVDQDFLLINSAPTLPVIPNSPNDPNFAGNALLLAPNTIDSPNQSYVNYDKLSEFGAAPNIDFYFPDHDPAKFIFPDLSTFAAIRDPNYGNPTWWNQLLGVINLDAGSVGGYADLIRYPNANAQQMNELALLKIYLKQTNIQVQLMQSTERDKYTAARYKAVLGPNPTQKEKDYVNRLAQGAWYGFIYESFLQDKNLQAFFAYQQFLRGTTQIKEWEVPMRKLTINQNNVKVTNVSVSMGNNLARLQLNMLDEPTYQHVGGLDTNITVTMRVMGEDDLTGIRQMFDIINGLSRLEHSHAVLGFLGIKNIITALCGTKYVIPKGYEVASTPGFPHVYQVILTFLDFDVFQQKRELLSSEQETEFIQAFGKKNPFLRIKQLWGAFNAYPDFPLSVRDKDGKILGHLDPDYYFRAYNSIDTDIIDGYKRPIPAATVVPVPVGPLPANPIPNDPGPLPANPIPNAIRQASDYHMVHHFGPLATDLTPISIGLHADGMDLRHGNDIHAQNIKIDEPHAGNMIFDASAVNVNGKSVSTGGTPPALYSLPHFQEDGSATNNGDAQHSFGLMLKDTQHRDKSGRMIRAFPTYMLWLIDEGGHFAGMKLFDNFYGLQSVLDFSIQDSEDVMGSTLVLKISNLYSRLSTSYANLIDPHLFPQQAALLNNQINSARNLASGLDPDFLVKLDTINLQPGVRLHLRMGYSANPNLLETVFNGTITIVEQGDIMTVTAQSDAIELGAVINNTNANGNSGRIDGSLMTGFWMSEPRDLMVRLLSMGASTFREALAHATRGTIYSENKYGIRHFGSIIYDTMTDTENKVTAARKIVMNSQTEKWGAFITSGGPAGPAGIISGGIAALVGQMWINFHAKRDYEIFKRNIYPGNGSGICQYQGGDMGDAGIANAMTPPGVTADGTVQTGTPNPLDILKATKNFGATSAGLTEGEKIFRGLQTLNPDPRQTGSIAHGILSGFANAIHPFSQMLGLQNEVTNDVPGGYFGPNAEVSFRAQTYMKSVWDIFLVCAALLPNYIVAVRPFEDRSTVFYGKPHWAYTSGVIPLSTGINEDSAGNGGPTKIGPDTESQKLMDDIEKAMSARDKADTPQTLYDQLATLDPTQLSGQSSIALATGTTGGDPNASTGGLPYTGSTTLTGAGNLQQSFNYFVGKNLTSFQSAGIIGNLIQESGCDPSRVQDGGGAGRGIAQWSVNGRWVQAIALANLTKRSVHDLGLQLDFLWQELNGTYKGALVALKATTTVSEAATSFEQNYEVAGDPNLPNRIAQAQKVLSQFGGGGAAPVTPVANPTVTTGTSSATVAGTSSADLTKLTWLKDRTLDPETFSLKFGSTQQGIPVDFTGQQGLKDVIGAGAHQVYSGFRSSSDADDIWNEFRQYFPGDAKSRFHDHYPKNMDKYDEIVHDYMIWMWDNAYNRGWIVSTADVIADDNPISGALAEVSNVVGGSVGNVISDVAHTVQTITNFLGGGGSQSARVYSFTGRALGMFEVYITQGPGLATVDPSQPNSGKGAIQWMLSHASAGFSHKSIIGRGLENFKKDVWDNLYKVFADPVKAVGSVLVGVVNTVRSSIMTLNSGLSMSGFAGKQANLLNSIYNDSCYYDARLIPGSLMWQADNAFTREYGEPVVEIRQPFQRMHYINSFQHILGNGIIETMEGVATVVTASSNGKNPKTVYFDKGAPTDRQIEKVVDTGLIWDEPKGFLGGITHPVDMLRSFSTHFNNGDSATDAVRCARTALKESLKNIYGGEILVLGDPSIRTHDLVYISDTYEKIYGMFEVEQVIHHFTPDMGFVTSITPNAIVIVNDPAKWQFGSIAQRQCAVQTLRSSLRRSLNIRASQEKLVGVSNPIDVNQLVSQQMTEIQGTTQFTGGASALVKDLGGMAAINGFNAAATIVPGGVFAPILEWKAFSWVRDNILDVHACYIQYLNRNGKPMDSGLSYNHGVAAGQMHVWSGLSAALGIEIPINIDGKPSITSDNLLQNLGWDEQTIQTVVEKDIDFWTQQTRANILKLTQRTQETPPLINPWVQMASVTGVINGTTLSISPYGVGPFTGMGVARLAFVVEPITISLPAGLSPLLDPTQAGNAPINYVNSIFGQGGTLDQSGYPSTVALRANPESPVDPKTGAVIASVFYRVPDGTSSTAREAILLATAKSYPAVTWDSYMSDGQAYSLNWELVTKGFATVDTSVLNSAIPGQGVSGG